MGKKNRIHNMEEYYSKYFPKTNKEQILKRNEDPSIIASKLAQNSLNKVRAKLLGGQN